MKIIKEPSDIKELCEKLKVTLNGVHDTTLKQAYKEKWKDYEYIKEKYGNGDHVAVLNHKNEPLTIIAVADINKAFGKPYLFIPNAMGVLKKNAQKEIISPTTYFLASKIDSGGNDFEYSRFILGGMLDNEYLATNDDETIYSFNEKFLIIKQPELITWKMREQFIIKHNYLSYEVFKNTMQDNNTFGRNGDRPPCIDDFVNFHITNMNLVKGMNTGIGDLIEPKYIKYFVSIPTLKQNLTNNPLLKGKNIKIHESLQHIL